MYPNLHCQKKSTSFAKIYHSIITGSTKSTLHSPVAKTGHQAEMASTKIEDGRMIRGGIARWNAFKKSKVTFSHTLPVG